MRSSCRSGDLKAGNNCGEGVCVGVPGVMVQAGSVEPTDREVISKSECLLTTRSAEIRLRQALPA